MSFTQDKLILDGFRVKKKEGFMVTNLKLYVSNIYKLKLRKRQLKIYKTQGRTWRSVKDLTQRILEAKKNQNLLRTSRNGGYFVETDRQDSKVPSPFAGESISFLTAPPLRHHLTNACGLSQIMSLAILRLPYTTYSHMTILLV